MDKNKQPVIFDYLDARQYLKSYFDYRKSLGSQFSYEVWAQELNFRSRSYLRMIILGKKRITATFCTSFCASNGFDKNQEDYFHTLVGFSQAKTQNEKNAFSTRLIEILKTNTQRDEIKEAAVDFVSTPLYPRLLTLLSFEDIPPTAEQYSLLLKIDITIIESALEKLSQLGLTQKSTDSTGTLWSSTYRKFDVPDNVGNSALIRFHEQSLHDAIQAIKLPKPDRHFRSLLLPLTTEELQEYHSLLENFASMQLARFQANELKNRKLYQINYNIFAITQKTETTVLKNVKLPSKTPTNGSSQGATEEGAEACSRTPHKPPERATQDPAVGVRFR